MGKSLDRNVKKVFATGSSVEHRRGNGRKKTPRRTQAMIKRLAMNKNNRSLRKVAGMTHLEYQHPRPKSINGIMYADMVREKAGPAVLQLYPV